MFPCVSGDEHTDTKTPTHQINARSREAHGKKMFFITSAGKQDRRGFVWVEGGLGKDY